MNDAKRIAKENNIIDAAEKVFLKVGFKNAKMDAIAKQAGITKVTLYSYFQSKENLYLGITYRALQLLNDKYYQTIDLYRNKPGLECVVALQKTFMDFCIENFLYTEALLEYFSMLRSSEAGTNEAKLTEAVRESIYFSKISDIQNLPFKLSVKEIDRGKADGSIKLEVDSMAATLHAWSSCIGFAKVLTASGSQSNPLFNVQLSGIRDLNLAIARTILSQNEIMHYWQENRRQGIVE